MGSKTIRLEEDVYEMLAARKREDETFSETVERLVGGRSLVELAGIYTEAEVAEIEDALEYKYAQEGETRRDAFENG